VRIVSLTITEGGYFYHAARDEVQLDAPGLAHDLEDPSHPTTAFGCLVEGLRRRRSAGVAPFTVLSCDNLHANGDVTGRVVTALASHIDANLGRWIYGQVAFPNSMVDRITPRTTKTDIGIVTRLTGLDDAWPVTCEPFSQWVIEDRFPTGRPAWERVGAQLVDDVRPYPHSRRRRRSSSDAFSRARAPLPCMTEPPHSRRDRSSRPATKTSSSWPEPPAPEPQRRPTHLRWSPAGSRPTRSRWPSSRLGPAAQWP
jgi:mannitol 2-dehydrogenase